MSVHMLRAIENLKKKILLLGAVVEEDFRKAVDAQEQRDVALARYVIDHDIVIDQMEVDVEEECLKLLALHHPVAQDLRFIVSVLKINNDLERIGDLSVNISERATYLAAHDPLGGDFHLRNMAERVRGMLKGCLDALVNNDVEMARRVCRADEEVDRCNSEVFVQIHRAVRDRPDNVECLVHYLCSARHLERIGDLATNIAEDVLYMVEGEIVRHKTEVYR